VISAWCGIRPLATARTGAHNANAASREHAVFHRQDGLVSVTGGKLTTYRAMAIDVLTQARREFAATGGEPVPIHAPLPSASTPLPGGAFRSREALVAEAQAVTHDSGVGEHLVHAYGAQWREVWRYATQHHEHKPRLVDALPYTWAEIHYAVRHELACTLSDVLVRRTHIAFETRDHGRGVARRIAPVMGAMLGWNEEQQAEAVDDYDADVTRLFAIDP
jgi:glycerol-3-phosphate dehydrogenase